MPWARRGSLLAVALLLAVAGLSGDTSPGASNPSFPYTLVEVGQVLGPSDLGLAPGGDRGTADASAVGLPDGRIRVYFGLFDDSVNNGAPGKVGSAISSDGVHFAVEPGLREPADRGPNEFFGSSLTFRLPDGRYRLFHPGCDPALLVFPCTIGLLSETSSDGLTFVRDPGLRLVLPRYQACQNCGPICSAIVKLADGRYRMYCAQEVTARISPKREGARAILSAVSSDLFTWTPEPGIRIGPGAPTLTRDAGHPTAVTNPDGSVTLVYTARRPELPTDHEMIAISRDGLTFDSETDTGIVGTEPSFAVRNDGSLLLYHGYHLRAGDSNTIHVARAAANRLLTVTVRGRGSVSITPSGLSCKATCTATFGDGQTVTLWANPGYRYVFARWSGGCAGRARRCSLRMNGDQHVDARFVRAIPKCKRGQKSTPKHPCRRR